MVISGVLSASPAGGVQVALWREPAGQTSFQQVAQTRTDNSGRYAFTLKQGTVMADQAWYVTSGALRSATLDQQVRALVGLVPSKRSLTAGQPLLLRGHVTPSHAGEAVVIEQGHGSAWRVIARVRLSKGSNYTFTRRFTQAGRTRLRAVLQGDRRNVQSISPVLALTVRP